MTPIPAANHASVPPTAHTQPTTLTPTKPARLTPPRRPNGHDLTVTTYHPANATCPEPTHPWQDPDHASAGPTNGVGNSLTGQAAAAPTADSSQPNADTEPSMNTYVPNRRLPSTPFTAPTPTANNPTVRPTTCPHPRTPPPTTDPNTRTATVDTAPAATPPRAPNTNTTRKGVRRRGHPSPQPSQHPTTTHHAASKHENAGFFGARRRATRVARLGRRRDWAARRKLAQNRAIWWRLPAGMRRVRPFGSSVYGYPIGVYSTVGWAGFYVSVVQQMCAVVQGKAKDLRSWIFV